MSAASTDDDKHKRRKIDPTEEATVARRLKQEEAKKKGWTFLPTTHPFRILQSMRSVTRWRKHVNTDTLVFRSAGIAMKILPHDRLTINRNIEKPFKGEVILTVKCQSLWFQQVFNDENIPVHPDIDPFVLLTARQEECIAKRKT